MKKFMMKFADSLLSKEQMKKVRGGCGDPGCGSCLDGINNTWVACSRNFGPSGPCSCNASLPQSPCM